MNSFIASIVSSILSSWFISLIHLFHCCLLGFFGPTFGTIWVFSAKFKCKREHSVTNVQSLLSLHYINNSLVSLLKFPCMLRNNDFPRSINATNCDFLFAHFSWVLIQLFLLLMLFRCLSTFLTLQIKILSHHWPWINHINECLCLCFECKIITEILLSRSMFCWTGKIVTFCYYLLKLGTYVDSSSAHCIPDPLVWPMSIPPQYYPYWLLS